MISARTRSTRSNSSWPSKRSSASRFPTRMPRRSPASRRPSSTSRATPKRSSGGGRYEGGSLSRRVVITGVGLLSSVGLSTGETWDGLLAGKSGIGPITRFDATGFAARIAGEVRGFNPLNWVDKKDVKKMDAFIQYALAAAQFAMDDAALEVAPEFADRVGVFIASGIGGFSTIEREHEEFQKSGPRRISPFFIPATIINLAAGQVSIRFNARGPNLATCTACTASAHSVGEAWEIIRRDDADVMNAGGSGASITPMGIGGFAALRALSTRNDEPTRA